ncbi:MAG: phosphatidate cytidylyltransferase [Bacteroidota bacterium]
MLIQYSQLKKRSLSALISIPIVITAIYWNVWSYFFLFLLVVVLAMLEFYRLVSLGDIRPNKWVGISVSIITYVLTFLTMNKAMPSGYFYLLCPMVALICLIELYQQSVVPFANIAYTLLGIVYVSGPFALLHVIAFAQGTYSHEIVIGILLMLWANDTGAYLVGSSIGKHKLFKRISPHKSWEGVLGGAALALIVSYVIASYFSTIRLTTWLGMSTIIVVMGTYGDLVESMLKRSLKVKDSGSVIPGHGGFLDRFDSFLLAVPCIVALIKLSW